MNPGEDMIKVTVVEKCSPYTKKPVFINKRDVFMIKYASPSSPSVHKSYVTITRWNVVEMFFTEETPKELLKLMGKIEE